MKPTAKEALLSWSRWRSGNAPDFSEAISQADSLSAKTLVVLLLAHQYEHWKNGDRIPAEDYLDRHLVLQTDDEAACDLVYGEFVLREMLGESPVFQDYLDRFPRLADDLKQLVKFERFTGALPWFPMSVVESEGNAEKPSLLAKDHSASAIPDYDLVCRIGSGAFGQVWLARNRHDHGYCAVKIIVSHADIELDGVRLYRACASDHPFLVPIKHVGEVEGLYYYVMPLADDANGTSLPGTPELYEPMTLKRQMAERTSPPPLEEVIAITRNLLKAIAHLHAHGVRHCDVKLENVMRLEGVWRLGDIGLAHRGESSAGNRGTQAYWPPEGPRDNSADLYSLGKTILLYSAGGSLSQSTDDLGKSLVFTGNDRRAGMFKKVLARACESDPAQRYKTAEEMLHDLDRIGERGVRRRPILIGVALLLAGVLALLSWPRNGGNPPPIASVNQTPDVSVNQTPDAYWPENLRGDDFEKFYALSEAYNQSRREGHWSEAVSLATSLLEFQSRYLPKNHHAIKSAIDNLRQLEKIASLPPAAQDEIRQIEQLVPEIYKLSEAGKLEEALREENRVYEIRHRLLGDEYAEVALGLIMVGYLEAEMKRYADGEKTTRSALRLLERLLGQDHPETAKAYNNFSASQLAQGKYDEAGVFFEIALGIRRRQLGNHYFTAFSHIVLVDYYAMRVKETPGEESSKWTELARQNLEDARRITVDIEQRIAKLKARLAAASKAESTQIDSIIKSHIENVSYINKSIQSLEKRFGPGLRDLR